MKLFISYCQKDGEGLQYARRAKEICKNKNIEAWVWADDSSSAVWLKTDIANNIDSCSAMLTIVTTGTTDSEPQKEEWSLASSLTKINSSIRREGLSIPTELRARKCPEFSDSNFEEVCNKAIDDIVEYIKSDKRAGETTTKEYQLAEKVKKRLEGLDKETINEFDKSKYDNVDWISRYYKEKKIYPTLPKSLAEFVENYKGEPISKNLKLKNPSMQSLRKLAWGDRRKLIGLILFLDNEPKDYLSKAVQHAPPGGDANRLEKELFEYYGLD
jgi:hypothetical protein